MRGHPTLFIAVICLALISPAFSGDLYLLSIDSKIELEVVRNVIDHAHGAVGGRFVVEIDSNQLSRLEAAGIRVEPIPGVDNLDRLYVLSKAHPEVSKTPLYFEPVFSSDGSHLVALDRDEVDILRKDQYVAIPVADLKTPFFYQPTMVTAQFQDYYPNDTLAELVSQDSLYSYDTRLEDFYTRHIYTDSINRARDWLVNKFQEFGYTNVKTDTFYFYDYPCHNVICIKEGTTEADRLVVIGGHYDSWNTQADPLVFAPGADDNASGTAVVLELARIFKNLDTKKSYMFVPFSAEEVGLVGSYHMAEYIYYYTSYDVECMLNFDMVAFTEDEFDNVILYSGESSIYADAMADAATRVTTLSPFYAGAASNSDHASFDWFGYLVAYAQEGDFNFDGWHTNIDISSRLDFPYFEQLVRMAVATAGHIDKAAHLTPIEDIWDGGDGHFLRVVWGGCDYTYDYKVLFGTASGNYTDTVDVPPSVCQYDITDLTESQTYYIAVMGINAEGFGPIALIEASGTPYVIPREPANFTAQPEYQKVTLFWTPNKELDLSHYRIIRRPLDGVWSILVDHFTGDMYEDLTAAGHVEYEYAALAIDNDLNESDTSAVARAMPATFDYPLLFVDETSSSGGINPSEAAQAAFYDSIFGDIPYDTFSIDISQEKITRKAAGQYKAIFWFDDDLSTHTFESSMDTISWFLQYETDFCLAGWQTIYWISGSYPLYPGDFVYDNFRISQVTENTQFDFIGAYGQNGWPNLQTRTDNIFGGLMPNVAIFATLPGAQVIYTFDSNSDDPGFEGQPAGVIFDSGSGKRIALAFPLYHLTEPSAEALMAKICEYFGIEPVIHYGDANDDRTVNLLDVTFILRYLYHGGPPPADVNMGDPDGSCETNLLDVTYLINYLYRGGPEPVPGCVEK